MTLRDIRGRFIVGVHSHPETEFKPGEHWRDKQPFWDRDWLNVEYTDRKQTSQDIATKFGVTCHAIIYWLKKHNIPRRDTSENHIIKPRKPMIGKSNPMYGVRGSDHPNWKGGCTPERQAFYSSDEWKLVVPIIWRRDNYTCQRCNTKHRYHIPIDIHHIVSFSVKELRCVISNLVLLCKDCHKFVHSKKKTGGEFIGYL